MKAIIEFFNLYSLELLGYTLLHSLWQGLVISIILAGLLRTIPTRLSNIRYSIATAGLLSVTIASLFTFIYLKAGSSDHSVATAVPKVQRDFAEALTSPPLVVTAYLTTFQRFIESCIPPFLMIWVVGALTFTLRIFMGLAYLERLRKKATPIGNEWIKYIREISVKLKIDRIITLAEAPIEAPVVIGYLKPFILIPIGMCASLSTAQLETIFIHELMHIRRKDYLVNLIQSFVEAVYFFNPFIWTISNMIRSEREHCCDDAVVQIHGNPSIYASALAALEEARLSKSALSLSLAGNKNELFKRIKRLMEKSVKNDYGSGKIISALLLVIGLVCASWISSTTGPAESVAAATHNAAVVQDTTKKSKKNKAVRKEQLDKEPSSSNHTQKKVEIDENVDVDKDINVEEQVETDNEEDFSFAPPPFPDFDFQLPPLSEMADMIPPPTAELELMMKDFVPPHPGWNDKDWEKFSKEFEEKFKSKFGDFYEKNEKDILKMMQEIQRNLNNNFGKDFEATMRDFAQKQEEWAKAHAEQWEQQAEKISLHSERLERLGEDMHRRGANFQEEFEERHKEFEKRHKAFEERSRDFEKAMKEELIKDGYLGKDEKLENIHFHNGVLKINGKGIKSEDRGKYNEIRKHYFGNSIESDKVD